MVVEGTQPQALETAHTCALPSPSPPSRYFLVAPSPTGQQIQVFKLVHTSGWMPFLPGFANYLVHNCNQQNLDYDENAPAKRCLVLQARCTLWAREVEQCKPTSAKR